MLPTPCDWPRLSAALLDDGPRRAIEWLCRAYGFTTRMIVDGPDGSVMHSELEYGEALVMVAGAEIVSEPETVDYGADHWSDRSYAALDCGGHLWWFLWWSMQRLSTKGVRRGA